MKAAPRNHGGATAPSLVRRARGLPVDVPLDGLDVPGRGADAPGSRRAGKGRPRSRRGLLTRVRERPRRRPGDLLRRPGQRDHLPRGNLADLGDFNVRWSNMSHVTVRSAPGTWHAIRSRIWIDDTSANVSLYGLTLDSGDFVAEPGATGLAINADNVMLQRNMITNRHGLAGSCITNSAAYGVATNLEIRANRIYDCGRDETHDHGIYTNAMDRPVVRANWIYENAGRGVNLGPATQGATLLSQRDRGQLRQPPGRPERLQRQRHVLGIDERNGDEQQHDRVSPIPAGTSRAVTTAPAARTTAGCGPEAPTRSRPTASSPPTTATPASRPAAASARGFPASTRR